MRSPSAASPCPEDQPPVKRPRSSPPGSHATLAAEPPSPSGGSGGGGGGGSGEARDSGNSGAVLYRVALIIADKKQRSLEIDKIKQAARAQAIELIVDDPSRWFPAPAAARDGSPGRGSVSPVGVDAIVHKISKVRHFPSFSPF